MEKRNSIFLMISFYSFLLSITCLMLYTIPNETKNFEGISNNEYMNIYYINHHPTFNYLNGLWLSFAVIGTVFLLELIELPNIFEEIDKKMMKIKIKKEKRLIKK
jgi:hypothetical protein